MDRFHTSSANELVSVKSYVFAKVRLLFDPTNAFLVTSLEKICSEYEQRLLMAAEDLQNEPNPNTKTFDEFLEHYGVLGMKWGVRKRC